MPRPAAAGAPRLVKVADRRAAAGPHLTRLLEPAAVASGPRPVGAADDPAPAVAAAAVVASRLGNYPYPLLVNPICTRTCWFGSLVPF